MSSPKPVVVDHSLSRRKTFAAVPWERERGGRTTSDNSIPKASKTPLGQQVFADTRIPTVPFRRKTETEQNGRHVALRKKYREQTVRILPTKQLHVLSLFFKNVFSLFRQ